MCEDGTLSGRGGCFYWPTLANEAAGGPILRKGECDEMSVVNFEFDKGMYNSVRPTDEWTPASTAASLLP